MFSILMFLIILLLLIFLPLYLLYQFDTIFLNRMGFNYLNSKISPPKDWPRIGSITTAIVNELPSLGHLKVKEKVMLYNKNNFLAISLSSDISPEQQLELENIVKGIIANHAVHYTVDYSQIELLNGGWFALFKLDTIEEATFNKNARASEPRKQEEFDDDDIIEL